MNNEPVAWMQVHYKDNKPTKFSLVQTWEDDIPLYTHPIKALTDEAIITIADPLNLWNTPKDRLIAFARAILRKASEK